MNADEIRAIRGTVGADGMARELTVQELFSREIAAHLAESNELKRLEVESINNLCGTVNLLTHEGSPISKLAGSAESVAVSLDILVNRGRI